MQHHPAMITLMWTTNQVLIKSPLVHQFQDWSIRTLPMQCMQHDNVASAAGVPLVQHHEDKCTATIRDIGEQILYAGLMDLQRTA